MPDHNADFIWDDADIQRMTGGILTRMGNLQPAHEIAGEIVHSSILRNFEKGGRPGKWKDLAPATKQQRTKQGNWPGQILVRSGVRGGLLGSISYDAAPDKVVFVANKPYAAIQNFGGQAGRGKKVTIPAREYMMIQDQDWEEIQDAIKQFIFEV